MNDKAQTTLSPQTVISRQEDDDEIDLLELVHEILQGKWLILFFFVVALLLAFIYAYGQSPVYKADVLLRVESQKPSIPGMDELVGLGEEDASVGTEIELIKSRKNLGKAVDKLNLDIVTSPKRIPLFGNLYKRFVSQDEIKKLPLVWKRFDHLLYKYAWGNEQIKVERLDVPEGWFNKSLTLLSQKNGTYELRSGEKKILNGKVGRSSDSDDHGFSIYVSELNALPGTEFTVTRLSRRGAIAGLQRQVKASEKGKKTGMISVAIEGKSQPKIVKILDQISATYVDQNQARSAEEASKALGFLEEQIKPVKERVDRAEANLRKYRTENQTADLSLETQAVLDVVASIDADLQKLSLNKEDLKRKYTENHPTLQALDAQVADLKSRKAKTQSRISKLPKTQQRLLKLERDIKVSNSIYVDLLNKIQEFKIAKASTVGNAYVVDAADIDESFVKPKKTMILALGALLGLILGVMVVFLRKALRHTVDNPEKLEEATGIPVYATIPLTKNVELTGGLKAKKRRQKSLLAAEHATDPAIEGLRSLRTSLHFALHESKNNIVMITGPSPDIGKSFIASNFAAVIASTNKRVILIDADMRKGYVHNLFNLKVTPGLSDIITSKATLEEITHTVKVGDASLDVISRGQTPPNPSELLMHPYFEKLLDVLSKHYDLVLIDTPPVHAVTDPTIIGEHAGVVFMVVQYNQNSMKEIEHAVSRLAHNGVETKGFIFNGYVSQKSKYGYGYGYHSYYGDYKSN